jgi:hypothetical protein
MVLLFIAIKEQIVEGVDIPVIILLMADWLLVVLKEKNICLFHIHHLLTIGSLFVVLLMELPLNNMNLIKTQLLEILYMLLNLILIQYYLQVPILLMMMITMLVYLLWTQIIILLSPQASHSKVLVAQVGTLEELILCIHQKLI